MTPKLNTRITSIDMLRGLVMVIMTLDHVRDYFHDEAFRFDPVDLSQSNPILFWTRFITHFCAPVFVFLAGTSAYFVGQRKGKKALSSWLLKRGFWLIIVELSIIKLAWNFKLDYSVVVFQVIWILGFAMVLLAAFIHVNKKIMISLSLMVILLHNSFDTITFTEPNLSALWVFLHGFSMIDFGHFHLFLGYAIIPWVFVMPLGYHFAALYSDQIATKDRIKRLWQLGAGLTVLFFVLRGLNIYGDPLPWRTYDSWGMTISSFLNLNKYPPSLLYLCVTLGPSIMVLAIMEKLKGPLFDQLIIIGKVPMFFYILHIYIIHALAVLAAMISGYQATDMIIDVWINMQAELQGYGFGLGIVYLVWVFVIIGMYPLCAWYNTYKSNNRDKWWLSYF